MKTGIIFDLDGTLWDSSGNVIDSWNEYLAQNTDLGLSFTHEQMKSFMGMTLEQIAALMFPMLPAEEGRELLRKCTQAEYRYLRTHTSFFYPGEKDVLRELSRDHILAIVSNCQNGYIQIFLEQCGFGNLFRDFECSGRSGLTKGENIKLVAQRNELEKCIFVGDTGLDGAAARAAGVPFVHADYGFCHPDDYDIRLEVFSALPSAVEQLLGA
ncbi:MAG: HAD family hydrolase, partial [Ruminiclostridium sp.]|nr:HAD family hydrolase [Ruminiclostridium sp.]